MPSVQTERSINRQFRVLAATIIVFVVCLPTGCGSKRPGVKVYPVRGEVFFKGDPAAGATIHFHPVEAKSPTAFAKVDEDGSFRLSTFGTFDGAAAGDYVVTVSRRDEKNVDGDIVVSPDAFGDRYSKRDQSKIKVTIEKDERILDAIELK